MADQMDPCSFQTFSFGDQAPAAPLAGDTDRSMHPVEAMVFEQQYKLPAPGTATPARKALTIDEVEKQLVERRKARRASFAGSQCRVFDGSARDDQSVLLGKR